MKNVAHIEDRNSFEYIIFNLINCHCQEKLAQMPAVDMQKVPGSFCFTVSKHLHMQTCGVWMAAWLENPECQLQAVEKQPFVCLSFRLKYIVFTSLEFKNDQSGLFHKLISSSLTHEFSTEFRDTSDWFLLLFMYHSALPWKFQECPSGGIKNIKIKRGGSPHGQMLKPLDIVELAQVGHRTNLSYANGGYGSYFLKCFIFSKENYFNIFGSTPGFLNVFFYISDISLFWGVIIFFFLEFFQYIWEKSLKLPKCISLPSEKKHSVSQVLCQKYIHQVHQVCFYGTHMQLISSAIQLEIFCNLVETWLDVILKEYQTLHQDTKKPLPMMQSQGFDKYPSREINFIMALSLPCLHNLWWYVMNTQSQKIDTVAMAGFEDRLGGELQWEWFIFCSVCVCGLVFERSTHHQLTQTKFLFLIQLYHWSNIMSCTVRLVESQAAEMNQVIKTYEKVWLATKLLLFGRVVLVLLRLRDWG
ncbi:hypothetical protein VP01_173g2 [Puccinia sorghi]|uniref:Uncharacterized protein n=1 Tax=Puccinia sorghi TaxID=27349 RepID=A0A0L6VFA3_9BASI|nr:hypothetical protein VP01_173g2 [Puccinia sorghi]